MVILIRKVNEDFGWLGNMSPYSVESRGERYRTAEALFQCMRFRDEQCIEEIRSQKSPMAAKMIAKRNKEQMVVAPMSEEDLQNMRQVLRLKVGQHPQLGDWLLKTGDVEIVEDCSKRPRGSGLFWGAALKDGRWQGENWLGRLWMELREDLKRSKVPVSSA